MDHDTYSANDAIGRVYFDINIIVEKMRILSLDKLHESHTFPIYDTLNGNRGVLTFQVKLHLLVDMDWKNYVQILSGYQVPSEYHIVEIVGLMHYLKSEKDPDYEWLDRIRTPRATNEARQSAIRDSLRNAAVSLAHKVNKYQCNLICGYQEYLDIEGSSTGLYTVRVLGTALRIDKRNSAGTWDEHVLFPILSIHEIPGDSWWNELRSECHQQAVAVGCNLVIGYSEHFTISSKTTWSVIDIAVIGCSGTAVVMGSDVGSIVVADTLVGCVLNDEDSEGSKERLCDSVQQSASCSKFHTPLLAGRTQFNVATHLCSSCRNASVTDFLLSTTSCPLSHYISGPKLFIQVFASKDLSTSPNGAEEYAAEVSNVLPYIDHDLSDTLLCEAKSLNKYANAIFDVHWTYSLSDSILACVVTGVLVRLICLSSDASMSSSLSHVLSCTNIKQLNDFKRFSWGTVKEAISSRLPTNPSISLKILNLKPSLEFDGNSPLKTRLSLNTFVGKIRRRQQEKDYVNHIVCERHLSMSIGLHDPITACNSSEIAGIHLSSSLRNSLLVRKDCGHVQILTRWSDVFIREDLTNSVKDSESVDSFVTAFLNERLSVAQSVAAIGDCGNFTSETVRSCNFGSTLSSFQIATPQFSVSKEHAHMIMLMSCDVNYKSVA
ncbi:hypothetical protein DICVIV_10278 [Dictyocaulus viviparus]|uniref:C2 domain-containing protein n=1 Tax=Dictyocaulus viviparus TaxID=29172 RepID=A0A0D8XIV2_DICVI|nr:hypothetical protein DICVIV_10278 [Dictyocaulus viviparus]